MYNADHRYHQILPAAEAQAQAAQALAATTSHRRTNPIRALLSGLARLAELRTLPFGGMEPRTSYDKRASRDY